MLASWHQWMHFRVFKRIDTTNSKLRYKWTIQVCICKMLPFLNSRTTGSASASRAKADLHARTCAPIDKPGVLACTRIHARAHAPLVGSAIQYHRAKSFMCVFASSDVYWLWLFTDNNIHDGEALRRRFVILFFCSHARQLPQRRFRDNLSKYIETAGILLIYVCTDIRECSFC